MKTLPIYVAFTFVLLLNLNFYPDASASDRKESSAINSKNQSTGTPVLLVTNKKNGKIHQVKLNEKIKVITFSKLKVKGRITEIQNEYIVIKNKQIMLNDIEAMRIPGATKIIFGTLLGILSLLSAFLGNSALSSSSKTQASEGCLKNAVSSAFLAFMSIIFFAAAIVFALFTIIIFAIGKKFTSRKWTFSSAFQAE